MKTNARTSLNENAHVSCGHNVLAKLPFVAKITFPAFFWQQSASPPGRGGRDSEREFYADFFRHVFTSGVSKRALLDISP